MCQELRSLGQSIAAFAGQFDARSLTPGQAGEVVGLCARIEASAASIKALAAARSADGTEWERYGYRSPAEQLADQAGMSPGAARRALETGRRLADQRSALDFLHPTCAVEGCSSSAGLQYDHREDFSRTRITAFDLLDRLCRHHHARKTEEGWALVEGRGKRAFVPPGDPCHPRSGTAPTGPSP